MLAANHRLRSLRLLNGMDQDEFAAIIGVKQPQLSQIERGERSLTRDHQTAARIYFKLPSDFFAREPITYKPEKLNFRRKKLSAKQSNMAAQTFGFIEESFHSRENLTRVPELPKSDAVRTPAEIEVAAAETRALIGVRPNAPIRNVTRCMDHIGIVVTDLANPLLQTDKIDGISTPQRRDFAFVTALARTVPGDRYRFSAAHELGHIMLHSLEPNRPIDIKEQEADAFASAFLLPKEPLLEQLAPSLTLTGYGQLKAEWGVSIQAIIRRAHALGVIDKDRYTSLFIQLSSRGWRKHEPVHVPLERILTPTPRLGLASSANNNHESNALAETQADFSNVTQLFPSKN